MAKPSITKRSVKGSPLTYSELDTNFENLQNATVSLTAGTGGTQVTADLNGNITLVAGTNITLTGDNTAKTITIESTGGGADLSNNNITVGSNDDNTVYIKANDFAATKTLQLSGNWTGTTGAYINLGGDIIMQPAEYSKVVLIVDHPLSLSGMTTALRDSYNSFYINGSIIYNTTTNKFQGKAGGVWVDLH